MNHNQCVPEKNPLDRKYFNTTTTTTTVIIIIILFRKPKFAYAIYFKTEYVVRFRRRGQIC